MTLGAVLERLVVSSPDVNAVAEFYRTAFGYEVEPAGDERRCTAAERSVWFWPGQVNRLVEAHFRFDDPSDYERFLRRLRARGATCQREPGRPDVSLTDPDGCLLHFRLGEPFAFEGPARLLPGRLQHYAIRWPRPGVLADFYVQQLGFTVSDWVRDAAGDLSAVFLRTSAEHHALAIFRSQETRLDHFSCETDSWHGLRAWADQMAAARVPMAWGVGRHGPGNDNFFMVRDPDGNLAEISCDLEVCAEDRPAGLWPHEARTLNLWGSAILRS